MPPQRPRTNASPRSRLPLMLGLGALLTLSVFAISLALLTPDSDDDGRANDRSSQDGARASGTPDRDSVMLVRGVVRDAETGAAVERATVTLTKPGDSYTLDTDPGGRFKLPVQGTGWSIQAEAEGYDEPSPVVPIDNDNRTQLTLQVVQYGTLKGTVLYRGAPAPGAALTAIRLGDSGDPTTSELDQTSGDDGTFEVRLPPGRTRLMAQTDTSAPAQSREVMVRGGVTVDDLKIDLTERGALRVIVLDPDNNPVPQARIEPLGLPSWQSEAPTTDAQGVATLDALPAGEIALRVTASRFSVLTTTPLAVEGDTTREVTLQLEALKGLTGRVVNHGGDPVVGAKVTLAPADLPSNTTTVNTNGAGTFTFDGLDINTYTLTAAHPHHGSSQRVRVRSDAPGDIVLRLSAPGSISGIVLSADRTPVTSARVVIERFVPSDTSLVNPDGAQSLSGRHFPHAATRGANGAFTLYNLAPGVYDIFADGGEHGPGRAKGIYVGAGRTTDNVTIELDGGGGITGRVYDAETRQPIADATVTIRDTTRTERNLYPRHTRTDDEGNFALQGLGPGRRAIQVRKDGYITAHREGVRLSERGIADIDIALSPQPKDGPPKMEFFGIGASVATTPEGHTKISKILEGSPSAMSGLQANDVVLRVDGQDTSTLGLRRSVELIRGEEGVGVVLQVQRPGEDYPFEVTIERGRVVHDRR